MYIYVPCHFFDHETCYYPKIIYSVVLANIYFVSCSELLLCHDILGGYYRRVVNLSQST